MIQITIENIDEDYIQIWLGDDMLLIINPVGLSTWQCSDGASIVLERLLQEHKESPAAFQIEYGKELYDLFTTIKTWKDGKHSVTDGYWDTTFDTLEAAALEAVDWYTRG